MLIVYFPFYSSFSVLISEEKRLFIWLENRHPSNNWVEYDRYLQNEWQLSLDS